MFLSRLSHVGAAMRDIGRAAESAAALARMVRDLTRLRQSLGPRSFLWDLVLMGNTKTSNERRMEAAERLARRHITRRAVFHPLRWSLLESAFNERRGDGRFEDAWAEVAAPAMFDGFGAIPPDTPLGQVWPEFRRRLRASIERDLLGQTLDRKAVDSLSEARELPTPEALIEAAHLRLDDLAAFQRLDPADQDLLREYHSGSNAERKAMAERMGIPPASLRQRVSRATRRARRSIA